jgi:hypothetical protein
MPACPGSRNPTPRRETEEAAPISIGPLTVPFGEVQRDRLRGTQQLVPRGPIDALQALGHFACPRHIPDRNPVDIALLMPELRFFSDYENDNVNVCILCATY